MGGSWVSIRHDELNEIPITDAQLAAARDFLRMVTEKSLSRHKQVEKILVAEAIEAAGLGGRKMIFYAGQNDWHAGIQPDGERRLIHSPLYGSSLEPLHDLDRLAQQNDWVVVFKPHPLDRDKYSFLRADEFRNTLILASTDTNVCIDRCDVFMTIASQTCYTAALRGKPVVMLGKNQIVGKGITYDVESREILQEKILIALQDPLGSSRSVQLARHAAQLERAYLFDFGFLENKFYTRGPRNLLNSLPTPWDDTPSRQSRTRCGCRGAKCCQPSLSRPDRIGEINQGHDKPSQAARKIEKTGKRT